MRLFGTLPKRSRMASSDIPQRIFERADFAAIQELLIKTDMSDVFENWKESVDMVKLEEAIKTKDADLLREAVNYDELEIPDIDDVHAASVTTSAAIELDGLGISGEFIFDDDTARVNSFFEEIKKSRIENITEQAQKSIDAQYESGIKYGADYQELARDIRDNIGLNSRQSQALANYKNELLDEGLSRSQVEKLVSARREKMLDYRAQMIARTETTKAISFGVQESGMQLVDDGLFTKDELGKEWIAIIDNKTTLSCELRDGTVVGLYADFPDESGQFDSTAYPPGHVGCRSDIIIIVLSKRKK